MEYKAIVDPNARKATACAVIGMYEGGTLGETAARLNKQSGGLIGKLSSSGDFAGKAGESLLLTHAPGSRAARVLVVGLGAEAQFGRKQYRRAVGVAAQSLARTGAVDAVIYLGLEEHPDLDPLYRARTVAEVFSAQRYRIPDLKTAPKPKAPRLKMLSVAVADAAASRSAARGLVIGQAIGAGAALSKDLANLPPNICTPSHIATRARQLAKEWRSVRVKVLEQRDMKALKMGALLAVGQGRRSRRSWWCANTAAAKSAATPICLIGKGITFDSGGICLKTAPAWTK